MFFGAWKAFVACAAYVDLTRLASWGKTPAPTRGVFSNVLSLELDIPGTRCQSLEFFFVVECLETHLANIFLVTAISTSALLIF
jgi:hypothetical protein